MHAFKKCEQGWVSRLERWEQALLRTLVLQVVEILAVGGAGEGPGPRPGTGVRASESRHDAEVLAALDFDVGPEPAGGGPGSGPGRRTDGPQAAMVLGGATPADRADWDQLLEALLPDASEDPEVALSVAQMAREHLRHLKYERLVDLAAEIHQPSGPEGGVLVPFGKESQWLSGLNDIRLALARALRITGPEEAEAVYVLACQDAPERIQERQRQVLAIGYSMLTWWQESLVSVMLRR